MRLLNRAASELGQSPRSLEEETNLLAGVNGFGRTKSFELQPTVQPDSSSLAGGHRSLENTQALPGQISMDTDSSVEPSPRSSLTPKSNTSGASTPSSSSSAAVGGADRTHLTQPVKPQPSRTRYTLYQPSATATTSADSVGIPSNTVASPAVEESVRLGDAVAPLAGRRAGGKRTLFQPSSVAADSVPPTAVPSRPKRTLFAPAAPVVPAHDGTTQPAVSPPSAAEIMAAPRRPTRRTVFTPLP